MALWMFQSGCCGLNLGFKTVEKLYGYWKGRDPGEGDTPILGYGREVPR